MLMTAEDRIARARTVLERRHVTPVDLLSADIAASWTRCLERGLDPERPPPLRQVEEAALRRAREEAGAMRPLVRAEMENLHQQIAGSNFIIAFARPDGLLLEAIADSSFDATARSTSIRPGSLWSEAGCGTNALGSVAATRRPLTIHGGEHFFSRYGGLTCTAVPILSPDGDLAGVLDASSDCRSRQQHTRALVGMAATQIENGLFRERHRGDIVLAFHNRAEYLHTLSAGLIALDPGGRVLGANPQARLFLHGLPVTAGGRFEAIFRTPLASLLDAARRESRLTVQDRVGSVFVVSLEMPRRAAPAPQAKAQTASQDFTAGDPVALAAVRQVEAAAARALPILIRGETGTGKELLARHAHRMSGRAGGFVPVNCAALPESLAEAELFGHVEGAFTGARRGGAPGLVVQAHQGTLFLDEIGDMPKPLQAMLLRLLDDWTVRPVGGDAMRPVDVLLVAATHVDLLREVERGQFRADLYYRLSAVEALLPPLRDRADFAAILRHLLAGLGATARIEPAAEARLAAHDWRGNIRELRNLLTRLTLADRAAPIDKDAVEALLGPVTARPQAAHLWDETATRIRAVHADCGGNLSATARRLGVSRNTIYRALGRGGARPSDGGSDPARH